MYIFFILLFIVQSLTAREALFLANDPEVLTGQLDNGLTYYIRENHFPEAQASFRLAVKVGSIYEEEHERGVAHFLEHMLFRGTKHFKDGEIEEYLQTIGAALGPDTNAYTSFASTVYELNIPLAEEPEKILDQTLLILSDWAASATVPDALVESERRVILEEAYLSSSRPGYKIFVEELNLQFQNSAYENRLPIGTKEVIRTVSPETLRQFYRKWYRPDRIALIAVGDFKATEIEERLQKYFAPISPVTTPIVEPCKTLQTGQKPLLFFGQDPELTQISLQLMLPFQGSEELTELLLEDVEGSLMLNLCAKILNFRLGRLAKEPEAPFLSASCWSAHITEFDTAIGLVADCFEGKEHLAWTALQRQIKQMAQYGFSDYELNKYKKGLHKQIDASLSNLHRCSHGEFCEEYVTHFIAGTSYPSLKEYLETELAILETITVEDLSEWIQNFVGDIDTIPWNVSFTTYGELPFTEDKLQTLLDTRHLIEAPAPVFQKDPPSLALPPIQKEGEILTTIYHPSCDVTELTLSNQVKIFLKPSKLEKNEVSLRAVAIGGQTLVNTEELHSSEFSVPYQRRSGLANLSEEAFDNFLTENFLGYRFHVSTHSRSLSLDACQDDLELIFQGLHAFFTDRRFDETRWDNIFEKWKTWKAQAQNDPENAYEDRVTELVTESHPLFHPLDLAKVDKTQSKAWGEQLFRNPQEFTFVLVGDFAVKPVQDLVKKYLASLPTFEPLKIKQALPKPSKRSLHEDFKKGKGENCVSTLCFPFDGTFLQEDHSTAYHLDVLQIILNERLRQVLRTERGETYSIETNWHSVIYPGNCQFDVRFTARPENGASMRERTLAEIQKLKEGPVSQFELAKALAQLKKDWKESLQHNSMWSYFVISSTLFGIPLDKILNREEDLARIQPEDVQKAAASLFTNCISVSWLPE